MRKKRNTNLFTHCGEAVQKAHCVHNKLIQTGYDSPLLYGRNLEKVHIKEFKSQR